MGNMKKPDHVFGTVEEQCPPVSTPSMFPHNLPDPSIRGDAFDQQLRNRGVRFIHKRAMPCPNINNIDDHAHDLQCPHCDGSGIYRYTEREIVGIFQGNQLERLFEQQGVWERGSAMVTFPTVYTEGDQADFNTFDHLVMPDFEARTWQTFEFVPGGPQKLRYPITGIDQMTTMDGEQVRILELGVDFNINADGNIEWIAGQEPPYDNINDRGAVISVSYFINPVYSVLQSMRELRVTQELVDGQKVARRLPQEVLVRRDFLVRAPDTLSGAE
jgi:hypothetical protein